jgi:glycosyltransferase involved in cell wall biosynthesis
MRISIAVCTHNEGHYVRDLLSELVQLKQRNEGGRDQYEIVVVDDASDDPLTVEALNAYKGSIEIYNHRLNGDFATHKNFLNSSCTGEWIVNLDADESLPLDFLDTLPLIIESNPGTEAYWLPRVNTVEGLSLDHVVKWGWTLTTLPGFRTMKIMDKNSPEYQLLDAYKFITHEENELSHSIVTYDEPIINWPDLQMRVYKNDPQIQWQGKVHEMLTGFTNFSSFPLHPDYAIRHKKEIVRQEQQNDYYATIQR